MWERPLPSLRSVEVAERKMQAKRRKRGSCGVLGCAT